MRNSFLGYSQKRSVELGLNAEDLFFLCWFIDYKESGKMERRYNEEYNNMMYWTDYTKITEDLPILFGDPENLNACKKKIQRMLAGKLGEVIQRIEVKIPYKSDGKSRLKTKVYLILNEENFSSLVSKNETKDTNVLYRTKMSTHIPDKNVHSENQEKNFEEVDEYKHNEISVNGQKCPVDKLIDKRFNIDNIYSANDKEEIWKAYPKKRGKADFMKKIDKILKTVSKEELLRAVERYADEVKDQDMQYIKNGSTFFNGGYVDYLDENYTKIEKKVVATLPTAQKQYAPKSETTFKKGCGERIDVNYDDLERKLLGWD